MKPIFPLRRQAGFTLIELMVTIAIGLFVMAIIGGIYVSSNRSFSTTSAMTGMDENARAIFDHMGNNVRHAGFNGCGRLPGTLNGDTRTGALTNWWENTTQPVQGTKLTGGADNRFAVPASANIAANTDALMLVGVDMQREASVTSDNGTTITIGTGGASPLQPVAQQVLLASSCQLSSFFVATGFNSATGTITHGQGNSNCSNNLADACSTLAQASGNATAVTTPWKLPPGSLILPVVANAYLVASDSNAPGKGRSLWSCGTSAASPVTPVCTKLANGVENLALEFGLDPAASGSVNRYVPTGSVPAGTPVVAVRAHLLLATQPDSGASTTGSNQYQFNGQTITPTDNRIYREYTAVFAIRNKTF